MGGLTRVLTGMMVLALAASAAQAQDDNALRKQVLQLTKITGTDPADAAIKKLAQDKDQAKRVLATALDMLKQKDQSLSYGAALVLSQVAVSLKDYTTAETFLRLCADWGIKVQSPNRLYTAYLGDDDTKTMGLIDLFTENKRFDDVEKLCKEILELKTDDGKPRIVMIPYSTRGLGEPEFIPDDESGFDTTRMLKPGIHHTMVKALSRQGKHDQALKLVDTFLKTADKENWSERSLKAWVLNEAGRYEDAAKTYEEVVAQVSKDRRLKVEDKDRYEEHYRYLLSNVYVLMKNIDKATDQLKRLLEKHPDEPGYYNDLGYIWADHDMNLDEAEKLIRKALDLDDLRRKNNPTLPPEERTENGAYLDSMGWVLYKQKKYAEAKDYLIRAVADKSSQHIEIFDHLGDVNLALGDRAAAVQAWQRGLEFVGESRRDQERKTLVQKKIEQNK